MGGITNLQCDCGAEPTIYIDMSKGPGCLCHLECCCGAVGVTCWDVRVPWDDLVADWNNQTARELRRGMKMGFIARDDEGRYSITDLGRAVVAAEMGMPWPLTK